MVELGQPAPEFELPDAEMNLVRLADFKGRNLVVYFYPRDDTPGCTLQAIEFSDMVDEFKKLDTVIVGISRDDCISHAAFRDKHGLAVELLADTEAEVTSLYGVLQDKEVDGHVKKAVVRSTFIIDRQGIVRHAMYGVTPKGHAAAVLNLIRQLN